MLNAGMSTYYVCSLLRLLLSIYVNTIYGNTTVCLSSLYVYPRIILRSSDRIYIFLFINKLITIDNNTVDYMNKTISGTYIWLSNRHSIYSKYIGKFSNHNVFSS